MTADKNITDIAALAGVSVSTVSRVLNNHPDVSDPTRRKVRRVMEEHSFIPNNSARSLKRESLKAVGVIVKGFDNPFFNRMLTIIQTELEREGYLALLRQIDPGQNEADAAASLVKDQKPRGLIFLGGNVQHRHDKLTLLNVPFVTVTITVRSGLDRERFSSVTIDDYAESYAVMERVLNAGHRNVGIIGYLPEDESVSRLRLQGFLQALNDRGLDGNGSVAYAGSFSLKGGSAAARELLDRAPVTCMLCISDVLALGAMRALHDTGRRIPQDVSVIGFDGIDMGRYTIPSLATVRQPDQDMAYRSVRLLMDRLHRKTPHRHLVFRAEFQNGESFAPRV